ncbi:MAG: serine/threonine protein kinase [Ruminococcus sp.]|nr:serine/threonine protein kinase [Ruminococcus sp.]
MIEINKKRLCESCFCEADGDKCPCCGFSAAEYTADPLVLPMGTRLNDKIVIGKVMGKGGFGVTYLGYDLRMEKTIAVKEYYPNGIAYRAPGGTEISIHDAKSEETFEKGAEKFYAEAEMVAQFNGNPNIVSVYDYFRANNTVYLVMEFIQGVTLKNYIKKHGRLSDGQALFVMDKIAAALSITHSAGVLHRDISPDNIMICRDGKVKLIDFGAARQIMTESSSNLTVVMKPGYTPIEQYTKKGRQGAWTDIYSLGVSIYYGLTEIIIDDPYARMDNDDELAENKHGVNGDLWTILKKCTMINASERYGSAIDLRKALKSVSAPIKAEPIVLADEDLNEERADACEAETAPETEEKEFPVTSSASEEVIEIFESESVSPVNENADTLKVKASKKPYEESAKGKNNGKKPLIIGVTAAAAVVIGAIGISSALGGREPADNISAEGSVSFETQLPAAYGTESESSVPETSAPKKETTEKETEKSAQSEKKDGRIVIDKNDLAWSMSNSVLKNTLLEFDGDIRVTLKLKQVDISKDMDGIYYRYVRILDGKGEFTHTTGISIEKNEFNDFIIENGIDELVFIIPDESKNLINDRMTFEALNLLIDSVVLEDEKYDQTLEFEGRYPGDWQITGDIIPQSVLKSYGSDLRITLDLDIGGASENNDLFYDYEKTQPMSYIYPTDSAMNRLDIKADNCVKPAGEDMYSFSGSGGRKFSFTITQREIDSLGEKDMAFQVYNLTVKRAHIESLTETTEPLSHTPEDIPVKPLYIPLNETYQGDWKNGRSISKTELRHFEGDVKITLDVETVNKEQNWSALTITDGSMNIIDTKAYNMGKNSDNRYVIYNDQTQFAFVLTKNDLSNANDRLQFSGCNIWVKGATVEDYDPKDDEISSDAKIIQLDSEYKGDWQESPPIMKKELLAVGGDVRITLEIEAVRPKETTDDPDANTVHILPCGSDVTNILADYITPCAYGDRMYVLGENSVPDKFTFVITAEEIAGLNDDWGLFFLGTNFIAKSAALEKA